MSIYDPKTARYPSFAAASAMFASAGDSPRAFLERCLETIAQREPEVRAFVALDIDTARRDADASSERWRTASQRSPIDGLPVGIKDCFDVRGFPTRCNCAYLDDVPEAAVDAAHVDALRRGGAIVVGKTVTTELTMAAPGPTWNPWDLTRTPGGSSSGSAAAVAASMLPIATGSQVRGSVLRPASICGVVGFKPTYGALNHHGGIDPQPSINHLGFLGATVADIWAVARHVATVAGGDPGYVPHFADAPLPEPRRPQRLVRQYTAGWEHTDDASRDAFETYLQTLRAAGIEILEPSEAPELRAYEDATARVPEWFFDLMLWEIRSPMLSWLEARPDAFSAPMRGYIERAGSLQLSDYARACVARERLRTQHRAFSRFIDGFITLAHIGPGQVGQPMGGTPWYNDASSAIGAPSINLPLLAVDQVPLGIQLMGYEHHDTQLMSYARWLLAHGVE